ncbi:exosortase Y-associated Wzy-like protein [Mucilaginibacter sp.]|uniref:exosortase Y-associated Wzy-like protein n=1 Tax=Mucilaginibacter sp. TaxID=1882438 RepID=UPI003D0C6921
MKKDNDIAKFIVLFIPWAISCLFSFAPGTSFMIAWLGSFFIFFMTLTGKVKPLPTDRTIPEQVMRPIFIVQIIFAGYMSCTSIFYFLSVLGYQYFSRAGAALLIDSDKLALTAECQRYYCLGHAAFAAGILYFMNYPVEKKYYIEKDILANLLMKTAVITFPVSEIFLRLPGLSQFYYQLSSLSFIAGTLALAFAIPLKKIPNTLICLSLYLFNFYQATISGFKEPIIISVLVLGLFLYPSYKKIVIVTFGPALILLFIILPSYVASFRQNAWSGDENAQDASKIALDASLNNNDNTNWEFLVYRLSEIDMFTLFVKSTPSQIGFYKTQLLEQSAIAIIPRVFWPSKPITEDLVMQRVYDAGVVNQNSSVSAKPAFIVDAYLSAGTFGVFIFSFLYGAIAQIIALKAEKLFGGYTLGTALIFSGLFQIFWRGLSFEFLINSVFWSYISMLVIFKILRSRNILKEV